MIDWWWFYGMIIHGTDLVLQEGPCLEGQRSKTSLASRAGALVVVVHGLGRVHLDGLDRQYLQFTFPHSKMMIAGEEWKCKQQLNEMGYSHLKPLVLGWYSSKILHRRVFNWRWQRVDVVFIFHMEMSNGLIHFMHNLPLENFQIFPGGVWLTPFWKVYPNFSPERVLISNWLFFFF